MPITSRPAGSFAITVPLVIVGAGGCGLTAALGARDSGTEVLVIERDATPMGTTAMSTGLIPAAGTPDQRALGIVDSPQIFAADIQAKAAHGADAVVVDRLTRESAETMTWLRDKHQVPLSLVDGFVYPGHSVRRMYGTPNRVGAELMAALQDAARACAVDILTSATVRDLHVEGELVTGVTVERPDGTREAIGCGALILACCGFAGNGAMVAEHIPELAGAVLHGHPGNTGDAIAWGKELGAAIGDIGAYQGHGGLAVGHAVTINWPLITEGGFQVNRDGQRFSNEARGYSEQAVNVVAQPDRFAWSVFDQRGYEIMTQFDDFQQAIAARAILSGDDIAAIAALCRLPLEPLAASFAEIERSRATGRPDRFGRIVPGDKPPLTPPFHAVKVTGALYHTQGGLEVDADARVRRLDGSLFPNLFAGGGAARGISGKGASGYIAGNGMLTATTLGKIAGRTAAAQLRDFPW